MGQESEKARAAILAWCRKVRNATYQPMMRVRCEEFVQEGFYRFAVKDAAHLSSTPIAEGNSWLACYEIMKDCGRFRSVMKPVQDHRCQGCQMSFHVTCECGWVTGNHSTRKEAYEEWRQHVLEHEAPGLFDPNANCCDCGQGCPVKTV